jgi:hypothetical protein
LPEQVAVVLGPEIIAERRYFFTAILEVRADGLHRAENKGEGAHDQQDNRKVGHSVLLCIEKPRKLDRHDQADKLPLSTVKQAGVGEMVNIAHSGAMLARIANFLDWLSLLIFSGGARSEILILADSGQVWDDNENLALRGRRRIHHRDANATSS